MAHRSKRPQRIIITADDFGLHPAVNEAVERAHIDGVLTTASLMVGAPAADDAVRRARGLPELKVGLHLVLTDGQAVSPRAAILQLVDKQGRFDDNMARAGVRFFFLPRVRRQLAAEIRAQFDAFTATGLTLDHVNTHKHFHLHPTVLDLILAIGRDYGLTAVRLPRETWREVGACSAGNRLARLCLAPWLTWLKARLARQGIVCNDHVFGVSASGKMDESTLARILHDIPAGVSEIYLHPATETGISATMSAYGHTAELAALVSPRIRKILATGGVQQIGFSDLSPVTGPPA